LFNFVLLNLLNCQSKRLISTVLSTGYEPKLPLSRFAED
jgi:hypothetical protein